MNLQLTDTPSEAWKTLRSAIPDRAAKAIANRLHLTPDHVRRWRREPLSDEAPLSSGQRSPLDRVCDLIDAVFLSNPTGASLIVEHVRDHYEQLKIAAASEHQEWDRQAHAARTLLEAAEAVNCLNLENTPTEKVIEEIVEARDLLDDALIKLMRSRRPPTQFGEQGECQEAREPVQFSGRNRTGSAGGSAR